MVVRRAPFGRTTFPERLLEPSAAMAQILEPADRGSREDLVRAANGYLDGVSRDDAASSRPPTTASGSRTACRRC